MNEKNERADRSGQAVNGETMVYGIIGDPVAHSFSPAIHNTLAGMLGHNLIYAPFPVKGEGLGAAVAGAHALGVAGMNVTVPHKKSVMPFLAGLDGSAEKVGAVNTLLRGEDGYTGFNTDCAGLEKALREAGVDLAGRNLVILGAGGAACAAAAAGAAGGAGKIFLVNRTENRALELVQHVKKYYNGTVEALPYERLGAERGEIGRGFVAIQTTSVGFGAQKGASPVTDAAFFENAFAVLDMIYSPWETDFLRLAREYGCPTRRNGFDMLVFQALAAYEIWRGVTFDREFCENALRILKARYAKEPRYTP